VARTNSGGKSQPPRVEKLLEYGRARKIIDTSTVLSRIVVSTVLIKAERFFAVGKNRGTE
jgi:hypothetical protein